MESKGTWWKTVAGFAALAVVMGALQWNWFAMPLERDEGEYAYAAWLMRTGKGVPYKDSFLQKPPMIVYTYALVEALAPGSDKAGFRVAGFLASLATAGLAWGLGRREFGGQAGAWAAWLWAAFAQQLCFSPVAANAEKFMVVPMLGAMALAGRGERRWWRWVLAGALAGAAALYKPICVPVLGGWFLWAVFARSGQTTGGRPPEPPGATESRPPQERTVGIVWRRLGWMVAGGVVAMVAGVGWFAWKGALEAMWECVAEYTGAYAKLSGNPLQTGLWFLTTGAHWKAWAIMGLAAAGFARGGRRGWGWGAVCAVAWWVAMTDANGHYYLMALPLAGMGAGAAAGHRGAGRWGRWGWPAIAVVAFAVMASGREARVLRLGPRELSGELYTGNPFVEAEEAGRWLAAECPKDGTVHVVGSEPEILWYARRKGATRFGIAYPMTLPTGMEEKYQTEALEALGRKPPEAVVMATTRLGVGFGPPEVYAGYLEEMGRLVLDGEYRLSRAFVPGAGWMEGGDWAEREHAGASLGIFAKRSGK